MKALAAPMAVGDYCFNMLENKIIVNREYQRNAQIWKSEARSFFIESILLGYPIPKMFLYSKMNLKTRQTLKEIVDGQQRSLALLDFYNNKFRLSKNIDREDLQGKNYNQLDDEWKEAFLSYSLPIDQFAGVDESDVRQAFRRMNSNNIPLNDEEKRNARYQGSFKWFVNTIATTHKEDFYRTGLMTKRDLIRMADFKFITDISFAVRYGIQTTKAKELDHIYKELDKDFPEKDHYSRIVSDGISTLISLDQYHESAFFKQHIAYAIILAYIAISTNTLTLMDVINIQNTDKFSDIHNLDLSDLLAIIEGEYPDAERHPFSIACSEKTNVKETRAIRVAYFYWALQKRI